MQKEFRKGDETKKRKNGGKGRRYEISNSPQKFKRSFILNTNIKLGNEDLLQVLKDNNTRVSYPKHLTDKREGTFEV